MRTETDRFFRVSSELVLCGSTFTTRFIAVLSRTCLINTKCYLVTTKSAYENRTPNWYTTDVSHPTEIVVSCARCARIHGPTEALSAQHTADPHWIIALPHCVAKADQVAPGLINGYPIWRQTNLNLSSPVSTPSQKQLFIALIESTQICITEHRRIYTIFIRFSCSKLCFVIKQLDTNLQSNITHRFSFANRISRIGKASLDFTLCSDFVFFAIVDILLNQRRT